MAGVQFTSDAAKRVANVVRIVEAGPRGVRPVDWGMPRLDTRGTSIRMATYTGSWPINSDNTVTFLSNTLQTAVARNILLTLPEATEDRNCAVAKDGTACF